MLKLEINMRMPKSCAQCIFYQGGFGGGDCIATHYSLYYTGVDVINERHQYCPLEEVEDD